MNAFEISADWIRGEVLQGKIMIVTGLAFAILTVIIFRFYHDLIIGLSLPALLIVLALCGYGANLVRSRPAQGPALANAYQVDPIAFRSVEQARLSRIESSLSRNKVVWVVAIVAAAIAIPFVSSTTPTALAIGFLLVGVTALAIDAALAHRAATAVGRLAALP